MPKEIIIQLMLCTIAIAVSILGMREDIDKRTFSNKKIGIIIIVGTIYATLLGRIGTGLLLFIAFNLIGVVLSSINFFSAADWKLFSAYAFFIPFENLTFSIIFIILLMICNILLKIYYTENGKMKDAMIDEYNALKVLVYSKQLMVNDKEKNIYKTNTLPATVGIVIPFILTIMFVI